MEGGDEAIVGNRRDCLDGLEEERLYRALKTLTVDWSKLVGFDWRRGSVRALIDELTRKVPTTRDELCRCVGATWQAFCDDGAGAGMVSGERRSWWS